jgi:hypothetical protein
MLESIIKVLQVIVAALPKIDFKASRKKSFGKALLDLHYQLVELLSYGDEIITCMRINIQDESLERLLLDQARLISRIKKIIRKNKEEFGPILAVHEVHLFGLDNSTEEKTVRVQLALCRQQMLKEKRKRLFEDYEIDMAVKNLEEIKIFTDQLRCFIVKNFQIDDVL